MIFRFFVGFPSLFWVFCVGLGGMAVTLTRTFYEYVKEG